MRGPRFQKALTHYQENGGLSLVQETVKFPQNRISELIARYFVDSRYSDLIINSDELKSEYFLNVWELDEELDGLHPRINEEIAPLQDNRDLKFNYWPKFSFKKPFVAEVPDVTVVGPDAIAVTSDGRFLLDTINSIPQTSNGRLGKAIKKAISGAPIHIGAPILYGNSPTSNDTESVAAILHSRWNNYYHWILEHLLKLRGIAHYERTTGRKVTLIIPPDPQPYITKSLELLGYKKEDYIEWNQEPLEVNRLVLPAFPDLTPTTIKWMRNELKSGLDLSNDRRDADWVYISRQKADKRRVVNYAEVKDILEKYDVQTVFCEDLSLKEEIRLFSTVDGIIGPHGAGLTASVWASNITMLEIFNNTVQAPYYVLAQVLGHVYTAITGDSIGEIKEPRNKNIIINIDEFEPMLNQIV